MKKQKIGVGDIKISSLARQYINQVLDSNRLSYGPFSKKFENKFARQHGCKHAVFSSSGTSSLQLAIQALKEINGWKDGDEIIVPAITFIATSNAVLHNNLRPIFVDVDLKTYNIDPNLIEAAITKKTRAIIPVHLMGLPCEMTTICGIAKKHRLKIIEDSCETMLAKYDDKVVGSWGDVACFSTYVAHLLVTGVGGIATTNNKKLAIRIRSLMNHGRDPSYLNIDDDDNLRGDKLYRVVDRRFRYVSVGHSARCTELEAALGLAQLPDLKKIIKKRQQIANKLIEKLLPLANHLQLPFVPPNQTHAFMLFPLLVKKSNQKKLVRFLEERGIETRDLMPILHQPIYKKLFGKIEKNYPNALKIRHQGFYIGCHQYLSDQEIDFIARTFHQYFALKKSK